MKRVVAILAVGAVVLMACAITAPGQGNGDAELAKHIRADESLRHVHQMALDLLKGRLNAGTHYPQVWIRDLNTFILVALEANPHEVLRDSLLTFFKFQGPEGDIVDGYLPLNPNSKEKPYRVTSFAPGLQAHKNTIEVDQESSLVQAVYKYVTATGDRTILDEQVDGRSVRDRMEFAMRYLLKERFDAQHGLIWSGTRADWGDVQPESPIGSWLNEDTHRSLSVYDNAMLVLAINDYLELVGAGSPQAAEWTKTRDALRRNIRKYLWDRKNQKYFPHVYLAGSPFPADFNENAIYYHGGTAVAIEAGLLSQKEIAHALTRMDADVRDAHAATIGLTMYPAYPLGYFHNPQMTKPYTYQNGGDWTWFGGRMVQDLIEESDIADAYREIKPMVDRVERVGGFYEWWTPDNQPRGSAGFRGSAGVLGHDIDLLEAWAEKH
jgi:Glycosyl hydrolase 36 superfamily, catalytic domain